MTAKSSFIVHAGLDLNQWWRPLLCAGTPFAAAAEFSQRVSREPGVEITTELFVAIARLRCAMPRNNGAMRVCELAESLALAVAKPVAEASFDKTAYQRDYMRRWRAQKKASVGIAEVALFWPLGR